MKTRIKSFFRDWSNIWFIVLLTVQFCVGLVYALDAERIHDSGDEIKLKVDRFSCAYGNEGISSDIDPLSLPYEAGANAEIDKLFAEKKSYPRNWRSRKIDVEFREGDDGYWVPAAYGKKADSSTGKVFGLYFGSLRFSEYNNETKDYEKIDPPQAKFSFRLSSYSTGKFDNEKVSAILKDAKSSGKPMYVILRQKHGLTAIGGLFIDGEPVEKVIAK